MEQLTASFLEDMISNRNSNVTYREIFSTMTYKLKLTDFYSHSFETNFGTCDLCMSSGIHEEEHFVFETSKGVSIDMENGYWDWGVYYPILYIDNTADFAHWLNKQEFDGQAPETEEELQNVISLITLDYDF